MTHVPPGKLAALWRAGQEFPPLTEPRAASGFGHVLDLGGWEGELERSGDYIRFRCPACESLMFQSNTGRGIAHALKVARAHKPACCRERAERFAETGQVTAWPDTEDE